MATVVIGIDGATFDLFDDWTSDLPVISSIINEGVSAELNSCLPPVTSPAWRCYATGKNPSSLGVYWWRQLHRDTNTFHGADEHSLQSKCYWEYLCDAGQKVGIIGVPLNAPPRRVNGVFVAGGPFANPDNYTYPNSLSEEIEEEFNYRLHPSEYPSVENARDPEIVSDFEELIHQRFDLAEWSRQEYDLDLLNVTLFYINTLQHKAWRCPEVKNLWEQIDQRIGELITEGDNVIIHSDHGLHEVKRVFYINGWLQQRGDLILRERDSSDIIATKTKDVGDTILSNLGIKALVKSNLPASVKSALGIDTRRLIDSAQYESRIDFEQSKAIALPQGPVYLLEEDETYRKELQRDLESVTDPETGETVLSEVLPAEDVYGKHLPRDSPDLLVQWNDGYEIKDIHQDDVSTVFGPPHGVLADNEQTGVLLAAGPDIGTGGVTSATLYDLAPTLLHLHGVPIPEDVDGSVLSELYSSDSNPANTPIETIPGEKFDSEKGQEKATQDVEKRLQDLGYLE